jgi:AmmeMemoRadiSam system protein A
MHPLIKLAKLTTENYIKDKNKVSPPDDFPKEFLQKKSGIFITIKKEGKLRACIGTYLPTEDNIAQEVIENTVSAATKDYRFGPIEEEELSFLSYSVYVLGEPKEIEKKEELDPQKYGVLVRTSPISKNERDVVFDGKVPFKSGLLLPGIEGINTIEEQFLLACRKGGINHEKEKVIIYRLEVEKYE